MQDDVKENYDDEIQNAESEFNKLRDDAQNASRVTFLGNFTLLLENAKNDKQSLTVEWL